jgi:hypothetical protein
VATLPNLAGVPIPWLPPDCVARIAGRMTTFDAGRGCPFQCSFCTIINVEGRVSRPAPLMTLRRSSGTMPRRASRATSSPTTVSRVLKRDPATAAYRDIALTPVSDEETLELLTSTEAARTAAHTRLRPMVVAG